MSTTLIHQTGQVIVSETSPEAEAALRVEQDGWALDYAANGYKTERKAAYASTGDQLDAIWKQMAADKAAGKSLDAATDLALGEVLKVKSDNPKPE